MTLRQKWGPHSCFPMLLLVVKSIGTVTDGLGFCPCSITYHMVWPWVSYLSSLCFSSRAFEFSGGETLELLIQLKYVNPCMLTSEGPGLALMQTSNQQFLFYLKKVERGWMFWGQEGSIKGCQTCFLRTQITPKNELLQRECFKAGRLQKFKIIMEQLNNRHWLV